MTEAEIKTRLQAIFAGIGDGVPRAQSQKEKAAEAALIDLATMVLGDLHALATRHATNYQPFGSSMSADDLHALSRR